ncbi:MAG TPA: oxygen-independent coproporphyrinogen III oxidase [Candidatus Kapabacteria bacterium]|nr:oxygen-independent coproporphyrinogen III oxidase [Candidatus Kapabacteria bacterium]
MSTLITEEIRLRQLLQKYDKPGPRYTSYPTAPQFNPAFGAEEFADEIAWTNLPGTSSDISLYVHFPFCDTLCYFCGCTMLVSNNRARIKKYIEYLKREIDIYASLISPRRRVAQMHWGGGTPTHLTPDEIADIAAYIRARFYFRDNAEISVEVDPREMTYEHVRALHDSGFNRASIGVQDFDPAVQKAVNRIQPEEITRQVTEWCRDLGMTSINMDMIYGLPMQTATSFEKTLDTLLTFSPDRVAVYNFAYVPWLKPHHQLIDPKTLPSPETKLNILLMTIGKMKEAGYTYIGMDHFAKETDELAIAQQTHTLHRSFQGYTTKAGCDLYGFGMSAISCLRNVYAQNAKTLDGYYAAIDKGNLATEAGYRLKRDDHIRGSAILKLMCELELWKGEFEQTHGIVFDKYFADALKNLEPLVQDGLIVHRPYALLVTPEGRLLLRNIAMCFDAYLSAPKESAPMYSQTV